VDEQDDIFRDELEVEAAIAWILLGTAGELEKIQFFKISSAALRLCGRRSVIYDRISPQHDNVVAVVPGGALAERKDQVRCDVN
jgi:hypothetical protein